MFSGSTAQDPSWKNKERADEARYAHEKEREQLEAIRQAQQAKEEEEAAKLNESQNKNNADPMDRDFEGGFGGQEDLEDRYATTSGEH